MRNGRRAGAEEDIWFFEKGVKLEGTLDLPGTFRLEGEVKGTVRCKDQVIVGEGARVEGDVQGAIVSVAGQIKGNVTGKNRVEILSSGVVYSFRMIRDTQEGLRRNPEPYWSDSFSSAGGFFLLA